MERDRDAGSTEELEVAPSLTGRLLDGVGAAGRHHRTGRAGLVELAARRQLGVAAVQGSVKALESARRGHHDVAVLPREPELVEAGGERLRSIAVQQAASASRPVAARSASQLTRKPLAEQRAAQAVALEQRAARARLVEQPAAARCRAGRR